MKKTISILSFVILLTIQGFSQTETVDVAQITLKVGAGKTKELYYGFAKGDQIVFNFEEVKGKPLKEIEIIELPTNSKFMDYKASSIVDKKFKVNKKAVYKFSFRNSSLAGRICRINIQRTPQSAELSNFNTDWQWKTLYDTTYVPFTEDSLTGYETIKTPYTKKELVKIDTIYKEVLSAERNLVQIHSRGNLKACFRNSESCTKYKEKIVYPINTESLITWIGIGQESRQQYLNLTKTITKIAVKGATTAYSGGTSLLISGLTDKATSQAINSLPTSKNEVDIYFTDEQNANFWFTDYNNKINTYSGLSFPTQVKFYKKFNKSQIGKGSMYICLKNNSYSVPVEVSIGVVAVVINKIYENKNYIREEQNPIYKTLYKKKMVVKDTKIRINAE